MVILDKDAKESVVSDKILSAGLTKSVKLLLQAIPKMACSDLEIPDFPL